MYIAVLVVLGLSLGSFVNALVWRLHEGRDFVRARSQCPHCSHELAAEDLVPVLSWLYLRGKCRYCHRPIAWQYPLVEAGQALVFVLSYIYWPTDLHQTGNKTLFITWLAVSVGLMALAVYDLRWMLLPNKILYPIFTVAAIGQIIYVLGSAGHKGHYLLSWLASIAVAGGVFFILYVISSGKWIGFGDVRLGLVTGTLLADPAKSFLMIFLASVLGVVFVLPSISSGKRGIDSRIPYGPFLILGCGISLLFGGSIIGWYTHLFQP